MQGRNETSLSIYIRNLVVKNTRTFLMGIFIKKFINNFVKTKTDKGVEVSFNFEFKHEVKEYWFAFCYPWSYEENK